MVPYEPCGLAETMSYARLCALGIYWRFCLVSPDAAINNVVPEALARCEPKEE